MAWEVQARTDLDGRRGCQHGECIVVHEAPASPEAVLWLGVEPAESFVLVDGVVTGLVLRT
jgi:hypothetical protein